MKSRLFPVYGNQESGVFPVGRNRITGVGWMLEVTRGRVDNENDNQSRYSNISNIVQGGGLYIQVKGHSHYTGKWAKLRGALNLMKI